MQHVPWVDHTPGKNGSSSRAERNKSKLGGGGIVSVRTGTTYRRLRLTTTRSLESFSRSRLVSKNLHGGIVPLKLLVETQLGEYFFPGDNMNHCSQEKGC